MSVRKFALLLRLSAEPGRRVPRVVLRELVFPDLAEKNARHSLRELVYQFRQAGVAIESDGDGLTLLTDGARSDYRDLVDAAAPTSELCKYTQFPAVREQANSRTRRALH